MISSSGQGQVAWSLQPHDITDPSVWAGDWHRDSRGGSGGSSGDHVP